MEGCFARPYMDVQEFKMRGHTSGHHQRRLENWLVGVAAADGDKNGLDHGHPPPVIGTRTCRLDELAPAVA
jgi:hypothetical protein